MENTEPHQDEQQHEKEVVASDVPCENSSQSEAASIQTEVAHMQIDAVLMQTDAAVDSQEVQKDVEQPIANNSVINDPAKEQSTDEPPKQTEEHAVQNADPTPTQEHAKETEDVEMEENKEDMTSKDESELSQDKPDSLEDAAKGCILGAFIGDAAGAPLEFFRKQITEKVVDNVLEFRGGGALQVEPGQITDDSEMALSLLRGLLTSKPGTVNQLAIAQEYVKWYKSSPFDIGRTTINAVDRLHDVFKKKDKESSLKKTIDEIAQVNSRSQSNGCLMRATPLSVYCYNQDDETIYEWTKLDVELTHSHEVALFSVVCYNIAIAHLLNNFGDYKGAYKRANDYVENHIKDK